MSCPSDFAFEAVDTTGTAVGWLWSYAFPSVANLLGHVTLLTRSRPGGTIFPFAIRHRLPGRSRAYHKRQVEADQLITPSPAPLTGVRSMRGIREEAYAMLMATGPDPVEVGRCEEG